MAQVQRHGAQGSLRGKMGKKSDDDKIGNSADPGAPLEQLPRGQNAQTMAQDDLSMGRFNGVTDLV